MAEREIWVLDENWNLVRCQPPMFCVRLDCGAKPCTNCDHCEPWDLQRAALPRASIVKRSLWQKIVSLWQV